MIPARFWIIAGAYALAAAGLAVDPGASSPAIAAVPGAFGALTLAIGRGGKP